MSDGEDDIPDEDAVEEDGDILASPAAAAANGVRAAIGSATVVDIAARRKPPRADETTEALELAIEDLNKSYALIILGGRASILEENFRRYDDPSKVPVDDRVRFITPEAFNAWHANNVVWNGEKMIAVSKVWMVDRRRRQYGGVTFDPDGAPDGYYNLWRGWSFKAATAEEAVYENGVLRCQKFLDHILENLAGGDVRISNYILAWAAHIIQRPTERAGIALAFRGKQGTGKTVFGQIIGRLCEDHYMLVDNPQHIVGNFNAHMASLLLLQADEGFWANDKQAEGRLKSLITSETQPMEMKGKDVVRIKNFLHLLVTSNHEFVVPAGFNERRFAVFDVGENRMQDRPYFKAIFDELEAEGGAGYRALMYFLQAFDLSSVDLWAIPKTKALMEQKINSLSAVDAWWFHCLWQGWIIKDEAQDVVMKTWPGSLSTEATYQSYLDFCNQTNQRYRETPEQVGKAIRKLSPKVRRSRGTNGDGGTDKKRPWIYRFSDLDESRTAFCDLLRLGEEMRWDEK